MIYSIKSSFFPEGFRKEYTPKEAAASKGGTGGNREIEQTATFRYNQHACSKHHNFI
jgi:hypothetical protein